jgi:hypothetical protein
MVSAAIYLLEIYIESILLLYHVYFEQMHAL